MKKIVLITFLLITIVDTKAQELEEKSISICYLDDTKRPDIISVTKAEAEVDGFFIEAFFDCSSPISEPCSDRELGKYCPNSIRLGKQIIKLGSQLNGVNVSRHNLGRFFNGASKLFRYFIFEMADVDCPNVPDNYCYIMACFSSENKLEKHIIYNKEYNPMTEEELTRIINSLKWGDNIED